MNDYFTNFISELSNLQAHQTGRFWWTNEVDPLNRVIRIVIRDQLSDMRLVRVIPSDYISETAPVEQARNLIQIMQTELEEATMMSIEEAIDQLKDLESDIWSGAKYGRPIYVADDDYRALQVALEALREKVGEVDEITD